MFSAVSIEQTNDLQAINIPDEGERVTNAEFEKIVESHGAQIIERVQQQMERSGPDGRGVRQGNTMIIRGNH